MGEMLKNMFLVLTLSPFMIFLVEVMCLWYSQKRALFYLRLLTGGTVYVMVSYGLLNYEGPNYSFVFSMKILIIFSLSLCVLFLCFKVKFKELIFALFTGYFFSNSHFYFTSIFLSLFFGGERSSEFYFSSFVFLCVYLSILWYLLFRKLKYYDLMDSVNSFIIIFAVILFLVTHMLSVTNTMFMYDDNLYVNVYGAMNSVSAIVLLFNFMIRNNIEKERRGVEEILKKAEENRRMEERFSEMIHLKAHDLKHQINVIKSLSQIDDDMNDELVETERQVTLYDELVSSGNKALDVIINEKLPHIRKREIRFSYIVDGECINFIKSTDVYALFGNIIDNAVEALENEMEENRSMTLNVYKTDDGIIVHEDNYCSACIEFEEGLPRTKKDASTHGFGTRSIAFIAQKYGGRLKCSHDDNMFSLDIMFKTETAMGVR